MRVVNVVGQADDLLVHRLHHFWNRVQASGTCHRNNLGEKERQSSIIDDGMICRTWRPRNGYSHVWKQAAEHNLVICCFAWFAGLV